MEFGDGTLGLALNLESRIVGAVRFARPMIGSMQCVEGSIVRTTRSVANIPVGSVYGGRIVNALGYAIDGLGILAVGGLERRNLESPAPSIMSRREDVYCRRLDYQSDRGCLHIRGGRTTEFYCCREVLSGADEAATLQFLAPYTGATIAEYFMVS